MIGCVCRPSRGTGSRSVTLMVDWTHVRDRAGLLVDLALIDDALDAHVEWLDEHYRSGLFLASGRREPRTGGVILASGTRQRLARAVVTDPFGLRGLAQHTVIEFHPSKLGGPWTTRLFRAALA